MRIVPILSTAILAFAAITHIPFASAKVATIAPNQNYSISLVRSPYAEDEFNIRFTASAAITGCYKVKQPDIEKYDAGAVIYVTLTDGELSLDETPSYGHHVCSMQSGNVFIDIPFSKTKLKENGTYKIEIKHEVGKLYDINLEHLEDRLLLEAEVKMPVQSPDQETETTLSFWKYPENTVVLSTPDLAHNSERMEKLESFALGRGMVPLYEVLEEFPVPEADSKEVYYVDQKNLFQDGLDANSPKIIGSIKETEEFYGPQGAYNKPKKILVFARAIGERD